MRSSNILSRHPLSGRNPACQSERYSQHSAITLSSITRDRTLYACGSSAKHLYFVVSSVLPLFLNSIINAARTRVGGTYSLSQMSFRRSYSSLAADSQCVKTSPGIPSGPHTFPFFSFCSARTKACSVSGSAISCGPSSSYASRLSSRSVALNLPSRNSLPPYRH